MCPLYPKSRPAAKRREGCSARPIVRVLTAPSDHFLAQVGVALSSCPYLWYIPYISGIRRRRMAIQPKPTTLGVIVGNRGFFPDHLCASGRADILRVLAEEGIQAVILDP